MCLPNPANNNWLGIVISGVLRGELGISNPHPHWMIVHSDVGDLVFSRLRAVMLHEQGL